MMPKAVASLSSQPEQAIRRTRIALIQRFLETYTLTEIGQGL